MELNVNKDYNELLGKKLVKKGGTIGSIFVARQLIQLRIDETGSVLVSEAEFGVLGCYGDDEGEPYKPPPPRAPRKLIFDKPFLIYLQEPKAKEPYFVGWMATTELMELKK